MSKLSRKLNMIEEARRGLKQARSIIADGSAATLAALASLFPTDEEDPRGMGVAEAALIAALVEEWARLGKPDIWT